MVAAAILLLAFTAIHLETTLNLSAASLNIIMPTALSNLRKTHCYFIPDTTRGVSATNNLLYYPLSPFIYGVTAPHVFTIQ
jgi:hypothetical protein